MPFASPLHPLATRGLCRAMALALLAGGVASLPLGAQAVQGGMRASVTILAPVSTLPPRASSFAVSRAGVISMETNAPVAGPTSQLVMVSLGAMEGHDEAVAVTLTTPAGDRELTPGRAVSVGRDGLTAGGDRASDVRLAYRMRPTGTAASDAPLHLRVSYLTVAGT